jgi:hypothetical protein
MEARLVQMEATLATLAFLPPGDTLVLNMETEVKIIKQAIALAKSQMKPASVEEKDLKAQRDHWKAAIKQAKMVEPSEGEDEIPLVKVLEAELAKLQPEPKVKSLLNQLKSANAAVTAKQEDRAKVVNVALMFQTQIDDMQQAVAKLDRQVADLDTELTELQQTASSLLEEFNAQQTESSAPPIRQPQPGGLSGDLSEADATRMILCLGLTESPEEVQKRWKQGKMEPDHAPPPIPVAPPVPDLQVPGGTAAGEHKGSGAQGAGRRQVKAIPVQSMEQKAAVLRNAAGLAREEQLTAARANAEQPEHNGEQSEEEKKDQQPQA